MHLADLLHLSTLKFKKLSLRFDITDALKDVVYEEIFSREDALIKKLASFIEDPLKEKTNRQRKPVVCKKILNIIIFIKSKLKLYSIFSKKYALIVQNSRSKRQVAD